MASEVVTELNKIVAPFALVLVAFVCLQAALFMRNALMFNKKHKLYTKDEILETIKSSAIITIGPSLSVMVVVLSMIPLVGSIVTFMRCGVIGSADFELMNANIALEVLGLSFDSPELNESVFTVMIFAMAFASAPWMLHLILTCKPLDNAMKKSAVKKRSFVPVLGFTAGIAFICFWTLDQGSKSVPNCVGIIVGLAVSTLVGIIARKYPKLKNWNMAFAILAGMFSGALANSLIG